MTVNAKSLAVLPQVDAVLNYLSPTNEKPCHYAGHLEQDERQAVATYERRRVRVHDARSVAESLSLDDEGCRLVQHESAVRDFWNDEEVRRVYYPEAEALIAAATGARWAFGFDHTVRSRIYGLPDRTPGAPRQPVLRVHADYTEFSAPQRVRDLMGQAADSLLRRRFAVISAWRPIRGPLYDAPLAICDANSTTPGDLVAVDLIYRDRIGETYAVKYNPAHRWLYVPGMQQDEVLLFKGYDSSRNGVARFVPHTAFEDPSAPADRLIQESIEFKALAFFS